MTDMGKSWLAPILIKLIYTATLHTKYEDQQSVLRNLKNIQVKMCISPQHSWWDLSAILMYFIYFHWPLQVKFNNDQNKKESTLYGSQSYSFLWLKTYS